MSVCLFSLEHNSSLDNNNMRSVLFCVMMLEERKKCQKVLKTGAEQQKAVKMAEKLLNQNFF